MADEREYVILASSAGSRGPRPVAVVIRGEDQRISPGIEIHIRRLPKSSSDPDIDYLAQLFRSWKSISATEQNALFDQLRELSSEPLFAQTVSFSPMSELPSIISVALGTAQKHKEAPWRRHKMGVVPSASKA